MSPFVLGLPMKDASQAAEAAIGSLERILDRGPRALMAIALVVLAVASVRQWFVEDDIKAALSEHRTKMQGATRDAAKRDGEYSATLHAIVAKLQELEREIDDNRKTVTKFLVRYAEVSQERLGLLTELKAEHRTLMNRFDLLIYAPSPSRHHSE